MTPDAFLKDFPRLLPSSVAGDEKPMLVTIDGPCCSGKSFLARQLSDRIGAAVIHTDDFVVPHAQKTPERLSLPGGNCDWERLTAEVILPWMAGRTGTYRRYDCMHDCLRAPEALPPGPLLILEGSYSNLPEIRRHAGLRVFMTTPEALRMERLQKRESPDSLVRFHALWIPLENAYFTAFGLPDPDCVLVG